MFSRIVILAGILLSCLSVPVAAGPEPERATNARARYQPSPGSVIRTIRISIREIFPVDKNFVFDVANAFHVTTRDSIIRRELLYREGDAFSQDLVDESERNLRKLANFIVGLTVVTPVPDEPGKVDLLVDVQDVWSRYFNFKLDSIDGVTHYNFKWGERNFLGRNMSLELEFDKGSFKNSWRQHFDEPRLFGSRWRIFERTGFYYDADTGEQIGEGFELWLIRPLFARSERWGWQSLFAYDNDRVIKNEGEKIKQYTATDGTKLDRIYYLKSYTLENMLVRSFGYTNKFNIGLYTRHEQKLCRMNDGFDTKYEPEFRENVIPGEDHTRHKLGLMLEANNHAFIKTRNLNNFGKIEDLALGTSLRTTLSRSQKFWGSDENGWYTTIVLSNTALIGKSHVSMAAIKFASDFVTGEGQRNMVTTLRYIHHIRNMPLGTLSLRAEGSFGERLDSDSMLDLGADNGLRGYVSNKFEGDRRVIFNAEYRFDPLPFIDNPYLGFAAFYDLGACWKNSERTLEEVKFYPAVGIGLRLAIPSLNPALMRFDFGFNLGNGSSSFANIFSFGYYQAF